jgi:hypothetical protein
MPRTTPNRLLAVACALVLLGILPAVAQQKSERLTPLVRNATGDRIGPTQRLSHERVDLSTITREDSTLLAGQELRQGESVVAVRPQKQDTSASDASVRRARAIAEQDDTRQKRLAAISD